MVHQGGWTWRLQRRPRAQWLSRVVRPSCWSIFHCTDQCVISVTKKSGVKSKIKPPPPPATTNLNYLNLEETISVCSLCSTVNFGNFTWEVGSYEGCISRIHSIMVVSTFCFANWLPFQEFCLTVVTANPWSRLMKKVMMSDMISRYVKHWTTCFSREILRTRA